MRGYGSRSSNDRSRGTIPRMLATIARFTSLLPVIADHFANSTSKSKP